MNSAWHPDAGGAATQADHLSVTEVTHSQGQEHTVFRARLGIGTLLFPHTPSQSKSHGQAQHE